MERVTERGTHKPAFCSSPHRGGRGRAALDLALALAGLALEGLAFAGLAFAGLAFAGCSSGGGGTGGSAGPQPPGGLVLPASGLVLSEALTGLGQVTDLAFLPDGRWIITEKDGAVKVREASGAAALAGTFPVDSGSEKGLLGVAADPGFASSRRLFFYYSASNAAGGTDLDRHRVVSVLLGADGALDRASERVLVRGLRGPENHDGGALAVGPDGKLYVGVGDTGCNTGLPPEPPAAPGNYFATCLSNGNGKILRLELDGTVPADNPLAGIGAATACGDVCAAAPAGLGPPRRDVWAWGFRNPWRFWFDPVTGLLWVGDVGEVSYEEIDIARPGRHHGWPWREGPHGWPVSKCRETVPDAGDCLEPVYHCRHGAARGGVDGDCQSITGGLIVDTPTWPEAARGRYWFGDNASGRVWSVAVTPDRLGVVPGSRREEARLSDGTPVALRLGPEGDLYLAVLPGRILRLGPR